GGSGAARRSIRKRSFQSGLPCGCAVPAAAQSTTSSRAIADAPRHDDFSSGRIVMQQLKELMSRDVKVISPEMSIQEAASAMRDGDFGMLPVGENDRMIGTISDRDIAIRAVADGKGANTKVRDVMSEGIAWAYEDDTVEVAAKIMSTRQVRRLPVVNRDKRLVGIVALGDFAVESTEIRPTAEALTEISKPS
ncbi:MAG: CBS domain-containing protein, partial [Casimicrobiaceae bacterium]